MSPSPSTSAANTLMAPSATRLVWGMKQPQAAVGGWTVTA